MFDNNVLLPKPNYDCLMSSLTKLLIKIIFAQYYQNEAIIVSVITIIGINSITIIIITNSYYLVS